MSEIDRQRVSAVRVLEATGHSYREGRWQKVGGLLHWPEADAMHSLLIQRADVLIGCTDGFGGSDGPDPSAAAGTPVLDLAPLRPLVLPPLCPGGAGALHHSPG